MTHKERTERRALAAAMIREGKPIPEVCSLVGLSEQTVQQACREFGAEYRTRPVGATMRVVAALFDGAKSMNVIGVELGVSRQRVQQIHAEAVEAGVPLPAR